jgi:hypothetical protein
MRTQEMRKFTLALLVSVSIVRKKTLNAESRRNEDSEIKKEGGIKVR